MKDNLQRRHAGSGVADRTQNESAASPIDPGRTEELQRTNAAMQPSLANTSPTPTLRPPPLRQYGNDAVQTADRDVHRRSITSQPQTWLTNTPATAATPQGLVMPNELPSNALGGLMPEQYFEPSFDPALLPQDVLPTAFGGFDPFQGFDIPFWLGQDNYAAYLQNTNGWSYPAADRSNPKAG